MGKSVTVAETLSAKGVRLDGCGQTHSQQVLGRDMVQDTELLKPNAKKMKGSYENYEEIVSELGNIFTTAVASNSTTADKDIVEDDTTIREKESTPISSSEKENILNVVHLLSRKELEELILAKIVEVLLKETEAGKCRRQVADLQKQKDKLQEQISHLCKEVIKMGKSIKTTCDRTEYALENNKFPTPVILYRSVGLQVNTGNVVQRLSGKLISGKGPETNGFTDLRKLNGFRAPPIPRPVPVANVPRPGLDIRQNRFKPPNSVGHSSKNILGSVSYTSPATYIGTPLPQPYTPNIITKNSGIGRLNASQGMKNAQSGFIEQLPPFPPPMSTPTVRIASGLPPKPSLTLTEGKGQDIILNWTLDRDQKYPAIESYQIYSFAPHTLKNWKLVGNAPGLELPMACTLSRFQQGNSYVFIVRAVDAFGQTGPFCEPRRMFLRKTY